MRLLLILISILYSQRIFSQVLFNDQARSDIKWEQIDQKNFRLIFPSEYRIQASLLSRQLPKFQRESTQDLDVPIKKINIILHATTIEQNGFVQLAPRKTEFFPIPSGVSSNVEWLPNLAIHELRHVAQMDKMTGRLRKPFMEQAGFALFGLQLPAWYFEGDAVSIETNRSNGGRGRLPSWFMPLRTNELSGRIYSFDKNILGSFKDLTPNYYATGYLMNTHLTNIYGPEVKVEILEDLRKHLLRPFSFYFALQKRTEDLNSRRLYQNTVDSLGRIWQEESRDKLEYAKLNTPHNRYPSSYLLPQLGDNGSVIALVQKPQKLPYIASVKDGKERRITYVGRQLMPHFHANKNLLIWDEFRKNARFGKTTFNVINIYDRHTRKTKTIRFENSLYTPSLSTDNSSFTAVEVDGSGLSHLVVYNLKQATLQRKITLPRGLHIQQPRLNAKNDHVVAIGVHKEGITLLEFDLNTDTYEALLPWAHQQIERPFYADQQIIYKAHYNGVDNIYSLNTDDRSVTAVTNSKFGSFNPSVGEEGTLLFNDYASDGYKIANIPLRTTAQVNLSNITDINYDINTSSLDSLEETENTFSAPIKKYNPLSHLFYFHSLSISDDDFQSLENYRPGLFWIANDLLNTSKITLGAAYDRDIRKSIYSAEFNYSKYHPKLSLRYQNRGQIGQAIDPTTNAVSSFDFREHVAIAEIQVPFSIYRKEQVYSYGINFGTSYHRRYDLSVNLQNFNEIISFPLNYVAYFNRNTMRAKMDLMPKWGQNISVSFRHVPFENEINGQILAIRAGLYFPGIWDNHGLQIRGGIQRKSGRYEFNNDIPIVSGFGYFPSPRLNNTLLFNYRLPLGYPDWNIAPIAFIKRFTAELFADYQNIHQSNIAPKTFGLGIYADLNAFRYILPDFNIGGRLVYINDPGASQLVVPMFNFSYNY